MPRVYAALCVIIYGKALLLVLFFYIFLLHIVPCVYLYVSRDDPQRGNIVACTRNNNNIPRGYGNNNQGCHSFWKLAGTVREFGMFNHNNITIDILKTLCQVGVFSWN